MRVAQLDGLRALAVVMVFAHHSLGIPLLWSGVDLFFILSGYLITSILLRNRQSLGAMLTSFYSRRAERILPAYVLFLLCAYPFVRQEWHHNWIYYVTFLQNIPYAFHLGTMTALVPLWSLAIEQHFYLVWPLLVFFLPKKWLVPSMLALLIGTPVLRAVCTPLFSTSETIYAFTPFRMDALAAGALMALTLPTSNAEKVIRWGKVSMVLGVVAYGVLAYHHPWFNRTVNLWPFNALAYSLNIAIFGGLLMCMIVANDGWLARLLSNRALVWLGRISYCFYLFHLLVIEQMQHYFAKIPAAIAAFVVTTMIASVSWVLLESPVLSLRASKRIKVAV
ncbi:acyltransferase [Terriglobus albidus]|uniref:Acyltransferase n=1 Tax=Terriglobus albidus TaxID=1592106 RepID=A0A5B9E8Q6_9BACT|nr:acyltransferase [Terriglobus albidus]QEE28583.1 acyltransferase [Terriglobus albidus]